MAGGLGVLFLARPANARPFDPDAVAAMHVLQPHLLRAVQIRRRLASVELDKRHALEALDQLDAGVLLVGPHGAVLHANRAAQLVLTAGDGLGVTHSTLVCARSEDTRTLLKLVSGATDAAMEEPSPMLAVQRPSGRRPLSVVVVPLRGEREELAAPSASAIVFVMDPERVAPTTAEHLRDLYGLTPAEARTAEAVIDADRLQDIADKFRVSLSAIRIHLQHVFEKTDTHRQAELVRLLVAHRLPNKGH